MTDSDDKIARRYRELAREEPPAALDAAILAASRRAVAARPSASRRWAVPVSIAAVLVLAFGVTLQMQREEPEVAYSLPEKPTVKAPPQSPLEFRRESKEAAAPAERDLASSVAPAEARVPPPPPARTPAKAKALRPEPLLKDKTERFDTLEAPAGAAQPFAPAPPAPASAPAPARAFTPAPVQAPAAAAAPAPSASEANVAEPRAKTQSMDAARPALRMQGAPSRSAAELEPTRELERIAKLREENRHEEADKALEEFRRANPEYRIPDAIWERVKPRPR
jgi:hypothetical protein